MRHALMVFAVCLLLGPASAAPVGLAADLRSPDAAVRAHAATALGRGADPSSVPALTAALKDRAPEVRREAAKALGAIKDGRAAGPLAAALRDADANVRLYAAYALGEIRDPLTAGALLQALRDPDYGVRDQAAWALRELRDAKVVEPLVGALSGEGADVAHIAWVLRYVAPDAAGTGLGKLLSSPDPTVRARAVDALARLRDPAAVEPLIAALKDKDAGIRKSAVVALAATGDERAAEPLKALAESDPDPAVREAAKAATAGPASGGILAAHWSFDDGNTKVAKDVTGRGTDGEVKGCTSVPGRVGMALRFGPDRYVELGKPAGLRVGGVPFTVMAWVKSDAKNGVVVARGGAFCGYSLYLKDGAARFGLHRVQDGPTTIAAGREDVTGKWVHLAGVVKEDRIELYVDGKLAATEKTAGTLPGECGQGMEIGFDAGNSPAELTDPFEGLIDEVKVFNAALTEAEIAKEAAAAEAEVRK